MYAYTHIYSTLGLNATLLYQISIILILSWNNIYYEEEMHFGNISPDVGGYMFVHVCNMTC